MTLPRWITFLIAALVIGFGGYRIWIAMRSEEAEDRARQRKGLYGLPRRTHFLFGLLYLLLGGFLIAAGLGYKMSPF